MKGVSLLRQRWLAPDGRLVVKSDAIGEQVRRTLGAFEQTHPIADDINFSSAMNVHPGRSA
jgi:hypothetical protein